MGETALCFLYLNVRLPLPALNVRLVLAPRKRQHANYHRSCSMSFYPQEIHACMVWGRFEHSSILGFHLLSSVLQFAKLTLPFGSPFISGGTV